MYHGIINGMPVYDRLEDVPDSVIESGRQFGLYDPPEELIQNKGMVLTHDSPLNPAVWAILKMLTACVLLYFVGTFILERVTYITQGRPGQKVDENLFEGGDGSTWIRDPDTGEWKMVKGPRTDIIIYAVVAIMIIVVIVLVFLSLRKKKKEPKKEGGKKK